MPECPKKHFIAVRNCVVLETDDVAHSLARLARHCIIDAEKVQVYVEASDPQAVLFRKELKHYSDIVSGQAAFRDKGLLSPRQKEVAVCLIEHRSNKEIADKLNITVRTVKFHVSTLLNKFVMPNRGELARHLSIFLARPEAPPAISLVKQAEQAKAPLSRRELNRMLKGTSNASRPN